MENPNLNIEGLKGKKVYIEIWHKNCRQGSDKLCEENIVPLGKQQFILEVDCDFCEPQRFNETFEFCVYKGSIKECT